MLKDDDEGPPVEERSDEMLDCDSDELEALEEAAEEEEADEEELDRVVNEAALLYPPDKVDELIEELKQEGLVHFMQNHIVGKSEMQIKSLFVVLGVLLPKTLREQNVTPGFLVSILKTVLIRHLRQREKLVGYNTVDDAVRLIGQSKHIVVLSGSGISTSVGIPDFRSKDGIYAQLQREGKYDLADPQEMFDKDFFLHDPSCFFSFAKSIFPSNFVPSPSHRFIKLLEDRRLLLRNYTQNIDTLEEAAGIERVLYCHGSFSLAQCTTPTCNYRVAGSTIKPDIFAQRVPYCPQCTQAEADKRALIKSKSQNKPAKRSRDWDADEPEDKDDDDDRLQGLGVMKPCITFFGEKLSDEFDRSVLADRKEVDLLIVMGTSLKVAPVSELVGHIPHRTPVILINKTPVLHMGMDIQLLGDADSIVEYLCNRLEWSLPAPEPNESVVGGHCMADDAVVSSAVPTTSSKVDEPTRVGGSHYWLFPGAQADSLLGAFSQPGDRSEESEGDGGDADDAPVEHEARGTKRTGSSSEGGSEDGSEDGNETNKHRRQV